ncbi:hypothetical protein E4U43_005435, partial [Claviceps pusilla]
EGKPDLLNEQDGGRFRTSRRFRCFRFRFGFESVLQVTSLSKWQKTRAYHDLVLSGKQGKPGQTEADQNQLVPGITEPVIDIAERGAFPIHVSFAKSADRLSGNPF